MADSEDTWPEPNYIVGPHKHLHAIGVISSNYNIFESALADIFAHHFAIRYITSVFAKYIYWHMAENQRTPAISKVFELHEEDQNTIKCVSDLLLYFKWCEDCRNKLMHSKPHLPIFDRQADMLYIAKRAKKTPKLNYGIIGLAQLRAIADQIRLGYELCFDLNAYLTGRDYLHETLPLSVRMLLRDTLPEIPHPPQNLELSDTDHILKVPPRLQQASPATFQPRPQKIKT